MSRGSFMAMFHGLVLLTLILGAPGRRVALKNKVQAGLAADVILGQDLANDGWNPFYSFQQFWREEGVQDSDIAKLQACFYDNDPFRPNAWPLRDHAKELGRSIDNFANDNKAQVQACITRAGGNPADTASLSATVTASAENACAKRQVNGSSLVQTSSSLDPFAVSAAAGQTAAEALAAKMALFAGSVATNSQAVVGLTAAVGLNTQAIAGLTGTVAAMGQVAAPTFALAGTLGISAGSVATMALAGSFAGPLVGVIALIYVTWPEEEIDPWLQVEARVSRMISDKFDATRRQRLGDRLRRYIKQFSQCAKAWVATTMVKRHGVALPRWIVEDGDAAKRSGNFDQCRKVDKGVVRGDGGIVVGSSKFPTPACMSELEGHMSLERDEWYETESGQMGGLFMPFANMHTQMLAMLADHPTNDEGYRWSDARKSTAAEYGAYMLKHTLSAWKAQVCRTMRLRRSLDGVTGALTGGYRYQWVVFKPMYQPNAAKDCSAQCDGKNGWCDFCGGKNVGACCKKGDTSGVCKQFDPPLQAGMLSSSAYHACMHVDCIQNNMAYGGDQELKTFTAEAPDECQGLCQDVAGAVAFTVKGNKCTCFGEEGLHRNQEDGSHSGPTVCGKQGENSMESREDEFEDALDEAIPNTPMEEIAPCPKKSPSSSDFADVVANHNKWAKECYTSATEVVIVEFNKFYKRIAKFLDSLAMMAGCGAQREIQWDQGGWLSVSQSFDAGTFGDCNWVREEALDKSQGRTAWVEDQEKARGWTGTNKIDMDEQKKVTMPFPMPSWLADLRRQHKCMESTAIGQVAQNGDARSSALNTMMEPVSMTPAAMSESSEPDLPFDESVRATV